MSTTVRPEQPDDFEVIDIIIADAFGSPAEAHLVRHIRATDDHRAELSFVAVVDDVVVGHVMISDAFLDAGGGTRHAVLMLSPLAVSPAHQRQGIGGALIEAVKTAADELGEWGVVLQGDPAYYGRFGFVPSADHAITMDLPDWAPPEAAQLLPRTAFGNAKTGHLVLPAFFAEFD